MFLGGQLTDFMNMKNQAPATRPGFTRIIIALGHVTAVSRRRTRRLERGHDETLHDIGLVRPLGSRGEERGRGGARHPLYVMGKNSARWNPSGRSPDEVEQPPPPRRKSSPSSPPMKRPTASLRPHEPVPHGGNNLLENVGRQGPAEVEKRATSSSSLAPSRPTSKSPAGQGRHLRASSAVDTDFTVKLCD